MKKLWEGNGVQVYRDQQGDQKQLKLTMPKERLVTLSKEQAFEMAHAITDDLRRWPRAGA